MCQNKIKNQIKEHLETGRIAEIYRNTYYSLLDRVEINGCYPESVRPGGYGAVMFCRTTGGIDALLRETEEYETSEKIIRFALDSARRMGLRRIPHIAHQITYDKNGEIQQNFSMDDQVDATLHVIVAWARLVLIGKASQAFEDEYYTDVKGYLDIIMHQPYFYYEPGCPSDLYPHMFPPESLKLVFNCAQEHSRENRRWSTFDILTQCFAGAALETMSAVAEKRNDQKSANFWRNRIDLLKEGIDQYMTHEVDGKKCYLEMRLPDSAWGKPFVGKGWMNWAPMPAGWEPLEPEVLHNTIALIRKKMWKTAPYTNGKHYMGSSYDEAGKIDTAILGKGIGWDIAYCLDTNDYTRILDWILFLEEVNTCDLLAENLIPKGGKWLIADAGNGEQCTWWCWAIAKLRKELGMSAAPKRNDSISDK